MKPETLLLRVPLAIILLMHSIPGMLDGGVTQFGTMFLDPQGFAPFGIYLAWLIKISHVAFHLFVGKHNQLHNVPF